MFIEGPRLTVAELKCRHQLDYTGQAQQQVFQGTGVRGGALMMELMRRSRSVSYASGSPCCSSVRCICRPAPLVSSQDPCSARQKFLLWKGGEPRTKDEGLRASRIALDTLSRHLDVFGFVILVFQS